MHIHMYLYMYFIYVNKTVAKKTTHTALQHNPSVAQIKLYKF